MKGLNRPSRIICLLCRAQISPFPQRRWYSLSGKTPDGKKSHKNARTRLPDRPARTRFAPSPTGYLHLGSLRTALYNYLLARATNGQFLLRLEDTDQSRLVPDAEKRLYEDLRWSGLSWDEGPDCGGPFGPYKQSERLDIYREHVGRLIDRGSAFRCFCTKEDLGAHQTYSLESDGTTGLYPGTCLAISADESAERASRGETHTVRFKSKPAPTVIHDIIYGAYKKKHGEDDFIIMKSDGFPTYHFANVVDDHLMEITHVIRGAEWLISTPKHVELYSALGWEPPKFAHVGLLVDLANNQKLSKRNADIGIDSYRANAIVPSALLNFSALLGWSPGNTRNQNVMTLDEMVQCFRSNFTKGDIKVDMKRLDYFQKKHYGLLLTEYPPKMALLDECVISPGIKKVIEIEGNKQVESSLTSRPVLLGELVPGMHGARTDAEDSEARTYLVDVARISRSEAANVEQMILQNSYLFWRPQEDALVSAYAEMPGPPWTILVGDDAASPAAALAYILRRFEALGHEEWTPQNLSDALYDTVKKVFEKMPEAGGGDVMGGAGYKYLRWALLALQPGPQVAPLLHVLGRQESLERLRSALALLETRKVSY